MTNERRVLRWNQVLENRRSCFSRREFVIKMSAGKLLVSRTNLSSVHCVVNLFWGYECNVKSFSSFILK